MFNDAGHALEWAYNTVDKPMVKMSGINHMRKAPPRGIENSILVGLSGYDRRKQAANIVGMVARLPDQYVRQYIRAKFGRQLNYDDLRLLVYAGSGAVGLGLDRQELVFRVVRGYFLVGVPYRTIRKMLGCRDQYALMIKSCLYDVLDHYHDQALSDMSEVLERKGLIEKRGLLPASRLLV